jgi:hypothetical protein
MGLVDSFMQTTSEDLLPPTQTSSSGDPEKGGAQLVLEELGRAQLVLEEITNQISSHRGTQSLLEQLMLQISTHGGVDAPPGYYQFMVDLGVLPHYVGTLDLFRTRGYCITVTKIREGRYRIVIQDPATMLSIYEYVPKIHPEDAEPAAAQSRADSDKEIPQEVPPSSDGDENDVLPKSIQMIDPRTFFDPGRAYCIYDCAKPNK